MIDIINIIKTLEKISSHLISFNFILKNFSFATIIYNTLSFGVLLKNLLYKYSIKFYYINLFVRSKK